MLARPHAHQAKILRHPHNENFTFLQLFMKIPLVFFIFGVLNLKLQQEAQTKAPSFHDIILS
ncbi:hypothetical protein CON94_29650 [Bacillus pseudomycoides]|nr:hypothetical protein CON94_29650 [Bacillus pseudomycoides]PEL72287.1 hypothetical protein CN615_29770 [Bacillus pseudomycoides]